MIIDYNRLKMDYNETIFLINKIRIKSIIIDYNRLFLKENETCFRGKIIHYNQL